MQLKIKWLIISVGIGIMAFVIYFLDGALPIGTGYSAKYKTLYWCVWVSPMIIHGAMRPLSEKFWIAYDKKKDLELT